MPLDREWVTVTDPDDDHLRYTFDVSFLLSGWRCIYGDGCPGIRKGLDEPEIGCCVHGAYLVGSDERRRLQATLEGGLGPESMQYHGEALQGGAFETDDEGEVHTRLVDGACIFLNRGDSPTGRPGCALHQLAEARGEHPMERKPTVCWQVPLHRTISEETAGDGATLEVHTIAAFERGTWGEGGAEFGWWCTEEEEAFTARRPLYRSMERELRAMVGHKVYEELAAYLDGRRRQHNRVRFLPVV